MDKIKEMRNAVADQTGYIINKINEFIKQIDSPIIHCLTTPD
jgi:hypothetical protein